MQVQFSGWPSSVLLSFRMSHLIGMWIWSSFWALLRLRLPCTHFKHYWLVSLVLVSGLFCNHMMLKLNYSVLLDPTSEKYLCPLPCSVTDWIAVGHFVPFVSVTRVPTVVFNSGRFMSSPSFLTEIDLCWCQYAHILLAFPNHCCQETSDSSIFFSPFQI